MPRYERYGSYRHVSLDGDTLVVEFEKKGGLLRRFKTERTEKTKFESSREARLAFAKMARDLREQDFQPVPDGKRDRDSSKSASHAVVAEFKETIKLTTPETITGAVAYDALLSLFQLRRALYCASRGEFFPAEPGLVDGLDPEPQIAEWEAAIERQYGGPLSLAELGTRRYLDRLNVRAPPAGAAADAEDAHLALNALFQIEETVKDSPPHIMTGLDTKSLFEEWKSHLIAHHGETGLSFFAEVAEGHGVEVDGSQVRTGRRRLTLRSEPPPRSGRGFDCEGEGDETLLEIEDQLLANRDDRELYAVYADRLQDLGNVYGDFIALSMAAETGGTKERAARESFLDDNGPELIGDLAEISQEGVELTWRHGFVSKARFDSVEDEVVDGIESLLLGRAGALLTELTLGMMGDYELEYEGPIEVLTARGPHRALQCLFLGDFARDELEISWAIVGDVGDLWRAFPELRELTLKGGEISLGEIEAPMLTRLSIRTGGLESPVVQSIAAAQWPRLKELELWFGAEDYGGSCVIRDLEPLLSSELFPKLTTLRLMNAEFSDDIAHSLARCDLLAQLTEVDLSMGILQIGGAQAISENIAAFEHLKKLDLSDNFLSDDAIGLFAPHPFVVCGEQKGQDEADGYRYVSVGE